MTTTTTTQQDLDRAWAKVANAISLLERSSRTCPPHTALHTAALALDEARRSHTHQDVMDSANAILAWMMDAGLDRDQAVHRMAMEGAAQALGLTLKAEDQILGLR